MLIIFTRKLKSFIVLNLISGFAGTNWYKALAHFLPCLMPTSVCASMRAVFIFRMLELFRYNFSEYPRRVDFYGEGNTCHEATLNRRGTMRHPVGSSARLHPDRIELMPNYRLSTCE